MANLTEEENYDAGIYQLELTDPVEGGPDGIDNAQAKGLANRTAWLKVRADKLDNGNFIPVVAGTAENGPTDAAVAGDRGRLVYVNGDADSPDTIWIAIKMSNGGYSWFQIPTG